MPTFRLLLLATAISVLTGILAATHPAWRLVSAQFLKAR
jgi:hypothetical protein